MTSYVFDEILERGTRAGKIPALTANARNWFRQEAGATSTNPTRVMESNKDRMVTRVMPGEMYLFNYDPKLKKSLPYYDTFPLIFPLEEHGKSFLGLNLHYLPLRQRAVLMDALYNLATDKRYDDNTRLRISYNILKASTKTRFFRPCVKRYLRSHVKSRFLKINAKEWDIALFLPLQRFQKATAEQVYRESRRMVT